MAKKVNRNPYDLNLRHRYYIQKKFAKRVLKHNIKIVKDSLISQLNEMVDKDPKKYWELVNELEEIHTEKIQHDEKIEPGRWVSHFKRLMHNVNMNLTDKKEKHRKKSVKP